MSIQFFLLVSICILSSAWLNKIKTPECHPFPVATTIDVASVLAHGRLYLFQFHNELITEELRIFQIIIKNIMV